MDDNEPSELHRINALPERQNHSVIEGTSDTLPYSKSDDDALSPIDADSSSFPATEEYDIGIPTENSQLPSIVEPQSQLDVKKQVLSEGSEEKSPRSL